MDLTETATALATALACGLVIGAERQQGGGVMAAGLRTFPLFALSGALGALLGWPGILVLGAGVSGLVCISYLREISEDFRKGIGMSSEMAALVTFALGALCTTDQLPLALTPRLLLAATITTVTLALLTFKRALHGAIMHISQEDLYAGTKLLLLLVVVLPLLPDESMGPYGALNPRNLGLLVLLISLIGLGGYVSMRALGARRGLGLTGLLGGLVSSTAVTLSFSGRAKAEPALADASALAIVLACATMFPRVLLELFAVSPDLARLAFAPALLAGLTGFAAAAIIFRRVSSTERETATEPDVKIENPFSIWSAIKFTAVFAVVMVVAHLAQHTLGSSGTYLAALTSGLADVDAITLSLAQMHENGRLDGNTALLATGIASVTNTAVKIGLAATLGGSRLGVRVGLSMGAALLMGAVGLLVPPI